MMIERIKKFYSFFRFNSNRRLFIAAFVLSLYFRLSILIVPLKISKKFMGTLNEESAREESKELCKAASRISYAVNRVCEHTPWESKCLVKALTAQYLLKKKKISSTLYLGVGKEGDHMTAHAWLRSGRYYLTGGCGKDYALVAKFRA